MTTPREHADDKTEQTVTDALRRAFSLGKTYWQQAHSDFISQHVKADATRAKFQELCERTEDTIDTLSAQLAEAQRDAATPTPDAFHKALRLAQRESLDRTGSGVVNWDQADAGMSDKARHLVERYIAAIDAAKGPA